MAILGAAGTSQAQINYNTATYCAAYTSFTVNEQTTAYNLATSSGTTLGACGVNWNMFDQTHYAAIDPGNWQNGAACGACAALSYSGRSTTVMIVDECGTCGANTNHLDLSRQAYEDLEGAPGCTNLTCGGAGCVNTGSCPTAPGAGQVTWHFVQCPLSGAANISYNNGSGNITYEFKDGSSSGWHPIVFWDMLFPIKSVSVGQAAGGPFTALNRDTSDTLPEFWGGTGQTNTAGPLYYVLTDYRGSAVTLGPINSISPVMTANNGSFVAYGTSSVQFPGCVVGPTNTPTKTFTPTWTNTIGSPTATFTRTFTVTNTFTLTPISGCKNTLYDGETAQTNLASGTNWTGNATLAESAAAAQAGTNGMQINYSWPAASYYAEVGWNWANYNAASARIVNLNNVSTLEFYINNTSASPVTLGVILTDWGGGGAAGVTASSAVTLNLPATSGWQKIDIPTATNFTTGGASWNRTTVGEIDLEVFASATAGTATVYFDNFGFYGTCPTNTFTPTNTATSTSTFTLTLTRTFTNTPTLTNSFTRTPTFTATNTPTITATFTNTSTKTYTLTPSNTFTSTYTFTSAPPTNTFTSTNTPTNSFTGTPTATRTFTSTPSNTFTSTSTNTVGPPTNTFTNTSTVTSTNTRTNTFTSTSTFTPTNSLTPTFTFTSSNTFTKTFTLTVTNTSTNSFTPTITFTPTHTFTGTLSPTATFTNTLSFTVTSTSTFTLTNTRTFTFTPTISNTPTVTFTPTWTATGTSSPTSTSTFTLTNTRTYTFTPTITNTSTITFTPTWTATGTTSPTSTSTFTASSTSTNTATSTPTAATVVLTGGPAAPPNTTQLPGVTNIPVDQVVLTNPGAMAVTLTTLTLNIGGTGNPALGITGLTLLNNGNPVAAVAPSGTTANFTALVIVIPPGSGVTLQVNATFAANAPVGTYAFNVTAGTATNGQPVNINGTPYVGAVVNIAQATATFTNTFTVTNTPTITRTPTNTLSPTPTFTPTNTGTKTYTPTASFTPTNTRTFTPTSTATEPFEDIFRVDKNLFNPTADKAVSITVSYNKYPGTYSLKIYNSVGEHIQTLADQNLNSSITRTYTWDGKNKNGDAVASGVYVLYLVEPFDRKVKRLLLIR